MTTRLFLLAAILPTLTAAPAAAQPGVPLKAEQAIRAIHREKAARTPAERKIDPHLLYAARRLRGQDVAPGLSDIPAMTKAVKRDSRGRVEVDVRGVISDAFLAQVHRLGGRVVSAHREHGGARVLARLDTLEELAGLDEVRALMRAERPMTNRAASRYPAAPLAAHAALGPALRAGSVMTEGDVAHEADQLRAAGIDGAGISIGVLSDGVDSLDDLVAAGELPPVTVIAGQAGSGTEGTAMLEIIHDMAPGANLFFATGQGGQLQMALNILQLLTAGCNIIVDDLSYATEPAFQDGLVAIAVNAVAASGGLYFSSAGNSGNLNDGTSGVWEGDFQAGGLFADHLAHGFDGVDIGNTILAASSNASPLVLEWSDSFYESGSDYDLYVVDTGGNLTCASTYAQDGDDEAREFCDAPAAGSRAVVVLYDGPPLALHLNSHRGRLQYATDGQTFGHNAAYNAVTVAAVPVAAAGGGVFSGGSATQVETFSSDGRRRLFYEPDGSEITPGNVRFFGGGGRTLFKVNITAADCVSTASPGFETFCGTSAAAPHAAAVAALLWSARPTAPHTQLRDAMFYRALDIEEDGWDRDSGYGIVMARSALMLLAPFDLTIEKSHAGSFFQGQAGAAYTIVVRNTGTAPSVGTATVADMLPAGLTAIAMHGAGWTCDVALLACTRSDALAAGGAYPPITLTVNFPLDAAPMLINTATVESPLDPNGANDTVIDMTEVRQRTTTLAGAAGGQYSDVTLLTAAVVPAVPGVMQFRVDGVPVGAVPVSAGSASLPCVITTAAGAHTITATFVSGDPLYLDSEDTAVLTVTREDVSVVPLESSPTSAEVNAPGGTAGPVTLEADVVEAADGSLGDIARADPVSFSLIPQLGGASVPCTASTAVVTPGRLRATCVFASLPVNLYLVSITVGGSYYSGSGTTMLSVYDPSLGFVTGGGTVQQDGYAGTFGFNVKFLKKGNAQGSLLYIQHRPAGDVVLKSNALAPLVIVGNTAAIQGKATLNGLGNHRFTAVVADNGEPGTNDRFGFGVVDPGGQVILSLSYTPVTISGGNIQVPQPSRR